MSSEWRKASKDVWNSEYLHPRHMRFAVFWFFLFCLTLPLKRIKIFMLNIRLLFCVVLQCQYVDETALIVCETHKNLSQNDYQAIRIEATQNILENSVLLFSVFHHFFFCLSMIFPMYKESKFRCQWCFLLI